LVLQATKYFQATKQTFVHWYTREAMEKGSSASLKGRKRQASVVRVTSVWRHNE